MYIHTDSEFSLIVIICFLKYTHYFHNPCITLFVSFMALSKSKDTECFRSFGHARKGIFGGHRHIPSIIINIPYYDILHDSFHYYSIHYHLYFSFNLLDKSVKV